MTKNQLSTLKQDVIFWRKQLRLINWKVEVEVLPWEKGVGFGANSSDPSYECCHVVLYDPKTIPEDMKGVRDIEVTLVHELLHARLVYVAPTSKKKKKLWPLEMAIETIAQSLVANRRGIPLEDLR